jgi:hypothetical protein
MYNLQFDAQPATSADDLSVGCQVGIGSAYDVPETRAAP